MWQLSLVDALWKSFERDHVPGDHFSSKVLRNALLLGYVTVVFDGLDEITNLTQRAEFVKRVTGFVRTFPLASIVVTSREVGYLNSPLNPELFVSLKLREFTARQRDQYVRRWFDAIGRPELASPFLHEAESVKDIANNPLLLSLLCSVYRAHGSIPTNRRMIYRRCADLLFYQWDARRQIEQNEDLPEYGNRIMEQIANLFYTHEEAQDSVDEGQLIKLISSYLANDIGASNASRRAQEFLEFCADRAWLLARITHTASGSPVYGFTHRTFYEFSPLKH
jgi:predicted NACHT family NTPase